MWCLCESQTGRPGRAAQLRLEIFRSGASGGRVLARHHCSSHCGAPANFRPPEAAGASVSKDPSSQDYHNGRGVWPLYEPLLGLGQPRLRRRVPVSAALATMDPTATIVAQNAPPPPPGCWVTHTCIYESQEDVFAHVFLGIFGAFFVHSGS